MAKTLILKDVLAALLESSDEDERVSEPDGFSSDVDDEDYDHRRDPVEDRQPHLCLSPGHQVTTAYSHYTAVIINNLASQEVSYPPASTSTPTYTATIITSPASQEVPYPPASTIIITSQASQEDIFFFEKVSGSCTSDCTSRNPSTHTSKPKLPRQEQLLYAPLNQQD
ncbi:unnamed protein product [Leuciscus chuanchicus]